MKSTLIPGAARAIATASAGAPQHRPRDAPGAGIAARDHPVNHAGDDPGPGHDFEVPPHDALETKLLGIEGNEAEITGKPDQPATDRVGQRAADIEASVISTTIIAGTSANPLTKMKPKPRMMFSTPDRSDRHRDRRIPET